MKKVLVTGGAGFIGSNLCKALIDKGYYVACLDNLSTGHIKNIQSLINDYPDRFKFILGDIRDLNTCKDAIKNSDCIFHEAALGSIPRSIKDPIQTNDVNINGFLNMLVAARDEGTPKFIFAASSSTYGDSQELPKIENNIGKPLSPYALTKFVNELYADVFSKTYGIKYIGLRYFNVFGRWQDPNSAYAAVIPLFIKLLMSHQQPTINGDGFNTRDYTYIDNVIHMNMLALETAKDNAINQIYNVAGGERTSTNDLFLHIRTELSKYDPEILSIEPIYGPFRKGDVLHSLASIEKGREMLGYIPLVNFKEGLRRTVAWYWKSVFN